MIRPSDMDNIILSTKRNTIDNVYHRLEKDYLDMVNEFPDIEKIDKKEINKAYNQVNKALTKIKIYRGILESSLIRLFKSRVVGNCWTWNIKKAAFYGDSFNPFNWKENMTTNNLWPLFILEAEVDNRSIIDLDMLVYLHIVNNGTEDEVRLKKNSKIKITAIYKRENKDDLDIQLLAMVSIPNVLVKRR